MDSTAVTYASGVIEYTVFPSTRSGKPAFACTMTGQRAAFSISSTMGPSASGPSEQFTPSAFTPSDDNTMAATVGLVPRNVRPVSSNVMVAKMGRSLFSLQASTAALTSSRSVMVSMMNRSAPYFCAAFACSANRL